MSDRDNSVPEGFRQIPGFPRYCISENGTVLSICRVGSGQDRPWNKARQIIPVTTSHGYFAFNLCIGGGKVRQRFVHTLVLTTFVGPCPDRHECRHLDGNKQNNHVSNLVWGTTTDNRHDRIRHGTSNEGEKNYFARLTEHDVREIRRRRAHGELYKTIAADFNSSITAVWLAATRRTWKHIE